MGTLLAATPPQTLYVTVRRDELRALKDERDQLQKKVAHFDDSTMEYTCDYNRCSMYIIYNRGIQTRTVVKSIYTKYKFPKIHHATSIRMFPPPQPVVVAPATSDSEQTAG